MGMFWAKGYRRIFADTPFFCSGYWRKFANTPSPTAPIGFADTARFASLCCAYETLSGAPTVRPQGARKNSRAFRFFIVLRGKMPKILAIKHFLNARSALASISSYSDENPKNDCRKTCSQLTQFANAVIWLRWFSQHLRRFG